MWGFCFCKDFAKKIRMKTYRLCKETTTIEARKAVLSFPSCKKLSNRKYAHRVIERELGSGVSKFVNLRVRDFDLSWHFDESAWDHVAGESLSPTRLLSCFMTPVYTWVALLILKRTFLIVSYVLGVHFTFLLLLRVVRGTYKHMLQYNLQKPLQNLTADVMTFYWKSENRSKKTPWYCIPVLCVLFNIRTDASFLHVANTEFGL